MNYDRQAVESLLPHIWSDAAVWGLQKDDAPDPDMPKGSVDPSKGNSLPVMLADLRLAWERSDLSIRERRALFIHYGLDQTQTLIAAYEQCDKATISRRIYDATSTILDYLNGTHNLDRQQRHHLGSERRGCLQQDILSQAPRWDERDVA